MGYKYNPFTGEFQKTGSAAPIPTEAQLNTEYLSPEQHGGVFGTIHRQYFGSSLPSSLTSGNRVARLINYTLMDQSQDGSTGSLQGWSANGTTLAFISLSAPPGNLALTSNNINVVNGWVDYVKA